MLRLFKFGMFSNDRQSPATANAKRGEITQEYYDADDAVCGGCGADDWTGLLKRVTDANGVETTYEYDEYGQPAEEAEGPFSDPGTWNMVKTTTTESDLAGRVIRVERKDASGAVLLSAEHLYFDNDLLQEVLYGNAARTVYLYDAADRLQVIEHQSSYG